MLILDKTVFVGPSLYAHFPVIRLDIDLGPLEEWPSGKLGPTLWQLPGNFRRNDERLANVLGLLPEGRHAFEFRHPSWFTAPVYRLLADHDAALVVADDPERPFTTREVTASWTFVRLHRGSHGRLHCAG